MEKLKNPLPEKPSQGIYRALEDLEWCSNNERYRLSVRSCHSPDKNNKICRVGGYGVIIARSQNTPNKKLRERDFIECERLIAINRLVDGNYRSFFELYTGETASDEIIEYADRRDECPELSACFSAMLNFAVYLESLGY